MKSLLTRCWKRLQGRPPETTVFPSEAPRRRTSHRRRAPARYESLFYIRMLTR